MIQMNRFFNILTITALSLLLMNMLKPRIEPLYLHQRIITQTNNLRNSVSEWANIYYSDQDVDYIPVIMRMTDFYLPLILNDFGVKSSKRVVIIVYSDSARFQTDVGQMDVLPMGAYSGSVIRIVSPSLWMTNAYNAYAKDYFIQYGPLIHEIVHYAADLCVRKTLKPWLSEGLALYYEYKYTGVEWRPDLAEKASKISMNDLNNNFRQIDERVAYRKAFDAVRVFVRNHGEDKLQQFLRQS